MVFQELELDQASKLEAPQVQVVVGTHALLQPDVHFAKLGLVIVDEQHPVFMRAYPNEAGEDELRPYVHVRFGINALIQRPSFYHLVNYGSLSENAQGETVLTLKSGDLILHLST